MKPVYLFDWGDTLMVDFPTAQGKMCEWETVQAIDGAYELLSQLACHAEIYIATGAAESSAPEIEQAFARVGLSQFITGYFCQANLGIAKGEPEFLPAILAKISADKSSTYMVGDSLTKDVMPALNAGILPIWFRRNSSELAPNGVRVISSLSELSS
ncbi:HAD family hydrolase [Thalassotalea montiporae]